MATKKPRKTTKAELDPELDTIQEELKNAPVVPPAQKAADEGKAKLILTAVSNTDVEKVVTESTKLSLSLQDSLSKVSNALKAKIEECQVLDEAIELKKQELNELGKKDVVTTSLDVMVAEYQAKKQELDGLILAARKQREEEALQAKKERDEEESEYEYNIALNRRAAEDESKHRALELSRANQLKQADLERGWAMKAEELKKREIDLANLQLRLANLDKEVEAKVASAVNLATNSLNTSKHFEVSMLKKDMESSKQMFETKLASASDTISRQAETITTLQRQLDSTNVKLQSIAEKSLESQSGQQALAKVQEFAQTQQPSNNKKA